MTLCQRFPLTLIAVALALLPIDMLAGPPPGQLTLEPYTFSSRGKANDVPIIPGPGAGGPGTGPSLSALYLRAHRIGYCHAGTDGLKPTLWALEGEPLGALFGAGGTPPAEAGCAGGLRRGATRFTGSRFAVRSPPCTSGSRKRRAARGNTFAVNIALSIGMLTIKCISSPHVAGIGSPRLCVTKPRRSFGIASSTTPIKTGLCRG